MATALFHGTSSVIAQDIKSDGFVYFKPQSPSAFGPGFYFYSSLEKATVFAKDKWKDDYCVIEVTVKVNDNQIRKFKRFELENEGVPYIERKALEEGFLVVDATCDDGIVLVRPNASHLIQIIKIHQSPVVRQGLFKAALSRLMK